MNYLFDGNKITAFVTAEKYSPGCVWVNQAARDKKVLMRTM